MRKTSRHTFFFGKEDPFSNWHPANFSFRGETFCCMEQFMMFCKARLFGDLDVARKIMETSDPKEHKKLGRQVKNFDKATWDAKARNIVFVGAREKFTQNERLYDALMATKGTVLVEASPYDTIWGVGLGMNDSRVDDPSQWRGTNWLGQVLTHLREELEAKPRPEFPAKPVRPSFG